MAKEKITHLFNKNHVEILKIENPRIPCGETPHVQYFYSEVRHEDILSNWKKTKQENKPVDIITEKKVSPLGFYYTATTRVYAERRQKTSGQRGVYVLTLKGDEKTDYQLKFYTQYDENISRESEDGPRPWDICDGDGDFPDNMVNSLVSECENLFGIMEKNGVKGVRTKTSWWMSEHDRITPIGQYKRDLYSKLFGNPKGPRFQTNEEKILAHGFDLKYSFRKDKEKK